MIVELLELLEWVEKVVAFLQRQVLAEMTVVELVDICPQVEEH